ncbi:DUF4157 domain-containing protein [Hymenobacter sp. BT175]|uniref:eCIS core domain-containing protein n=1 Tax=Hymenobacter translucens TaxID=2886507 RepID=UPI001D0EBE36|nr:DUF4157 domain-containing protein [Hymenobacter translucens]MCC2546300.1 DUF4157 domain-containing protein [Hymenobacter translucens]
MTDYQAEKPLESEARSNAQPAGHRPTPLGEVIPFMDRRPAAVAQRRLQEAVSSRMLVGTAKNKSAVAGNVAEPVQCQAAEPDAARPVNKSGLPDQLKAGVEKLSGHSLDDVRVHYNSDRPAQMQAHAYAQGTDIHVAPGQEQHLPHEAWHVVQQKQGRVRATRQLKGSVALNDDHDLECEAAVMGARAQTAAMPEGAAAQRCAPGQAVVQQQTGGAAVVQRVTGAEKVKMWVPTALESAEAIYLIDAAHRGDMYHIRAALAVQPLPVLIYNCTAPNDLVHYLSQGGKLAGTLVMTMAWNPAVDEPPVEQADAYVSKKEDGFRIISESAATTVLAGKGTPKNTADKMSSVPEELQEEIKVKIPEVFGAKQGNAALVMFRDSGEKSAVYPELDSGGALSELATMINEKGFTAILCGNPDAPQYQAFRSIGSYWTHLNVGEAALKRDVEAYFMQEAHRQGYYKVAVGFRSGVLDSFTFMGVPTISISLNGLVGEDRHNRLATPTWNRTNILYDTPRHADTGAVDAKRGGQVLMSPKWKMEKPEEEVVPSSRVLLPPKGFSESDKSLVDKGLSIGLAKLDKGKEPYPGFGQGAVTSQAMRGVLPADLVKLGATAEEQLVKVNLVTKYLEAEKNREVDAAWHAQKDFEKVEELWNTKIRSILEGRAFALKMREDGRMKKEQSGLAMSGGKPPKKVKEKKGKAAAKVAEPTNSNPDNL